MSFEYGLLIFLQLAAKVPTVWYIYWKALQGFTVSSKSMHNVHADANSFLQYADCCYRLRSMARMETRMVLVGTVPAGLTA